MIHTAWTAIAKIASQNGPQPVPGGRKANANLGAAYANENQMDAAARYWRRALQLNPALWQMHLSLARFYAARGQNHLAQVHQDAAQRLQNQNKASR